MRQSLWKDTRAATSIEYGIVAAAIGIGLLLGASKLRDLASASIEQLAGGNSMKVESCSPGETCRPHAQDRGRDGAPVQNTGQSPGPR